MLNRHRTTCLDGLRFLRRCMHSLADVSSHPSHPSAHARNSTSRHTTRDPRSRSQSRPEEFEIITIFR